MLLLGLSLASALGIGAWKTHYLTWDESVNILDHLNLAISSTLHLIGTQTESGTLMHTVLLAALCFAGFSFMLNCTVQLTVEEGEEESLYSLILESKILQAILIFLSASYFIANGISVDMWLLIGLLGWILATHLIVGMSLNTSHSGVLNSALTMISLALISIGTLQSLLITIDWILTNQYIHAFSGAALLVISALLWWSSIGQLIKNFGKNSNDDLF